MKIIAMIPARYSASRFPGKLMKNLGGKPVIVRTYQAAVTANLFDEVYVVTDSEIIFKTIEKAGGKAIMSIKEHECGSDRIAEAVESLEADIVVNVQGDEPFIDTVSLSKLIKSFEDDKNNTIDLASLKVAMTSLEDIENPNNVKVITDVNNFAIYFSRSVIPFHRDKELNVTYYKHKGVYAFRKQALLDFYNTPMTPIEAAEKIECIRYLEVGKKIKMIETSVESIGIDTPEDLEKAIKQLENE
ncbi:3-deoxy-manno-octulosonate cytidylyltransferase [Tenacibaculum finnmarkense genomovar finnmarkense]|uniref:3-deoxy-manno-octulosonate cytidylyltransferase n=1 Tax=Tenacibaculum finnmarkense genomovar ulcerans TaxID=2781388 RepID=A0A2I2LDA3_9FLAO|nr:3-deoxy-manno-octulosonate cytidylyltransferase [Tenacibaculum finnmarkense]ALU74456.1 3-deoxy-manno-octulosonate cytidylyltransferase [Tenacibaculum dicentrarchi]MBE7634908.1 3-deoxy-manno-octulosonate cytidylyltransferase [Tenacibaculum finnmarkense genomovar ulcerans]MBE7647492.1 3-deoxy-manno-octulosonate cytidylyltransferase [Tenacibaculum finnmarkense genomovar ulcerans]MBE7687729.1 3-deoxy-manno-octulosonate cytidylyltransferase [Tenacibaculum finnmarkense genomovar ulcerans]MBE76973